MKGQAPSVEDMTEFVDICFDCADKGKRVVAFCSRGDDRTATMVAAWIVVSSMSLSPKSIAPEVAICHAENLRTQCSSAKRENVSFLVQLIIILTRIVYITQNSTYITHSQ